MPLVSKAFGDIITFTRASTATYFDSAGVLTSAAIDAPRLDYNPSTLAAQGLLFEEARTNSIRNNTMQGAVAGTPGTGPTNWALNSGATLSVQVSGVGSENGIAYVDVRFFGTNTSGVTQFPSVFFDTTTGITSAPGQTLTGSLYLRLAAGTGSNFDTAIHEHDSGGAFLRSTVMTGGSGVPVTGSLSTGRRAGVATTGASTAFVRPLIACSVLNGASHDITIRIGLPQLEQGAFATSVIPTSTTALTRSADVASVNTLSPWFNSSAGTLYTESFRTTIAAVSTFPSYAEFDNGTLNRYGVYNALTVGANEYRSFVQDAGVGQADIGGAASRVAAGTVVKQAAAFAANDFALSVNGSSVFTDTAGTLPGSVNRLSIGSSFIASNFANAWIRRITYYPRRLSNAELQAITA